MVTLIVGLDGSQRGAVDALAALLFHSGVRLAVLSEIGVEAVLVAHGRQITPQRLLAGGRERGAAEEEKHKFCAQEFRPQNVHQKSSVDFLWPPAWVSAR